LSRRAWSGHDPWRTFDVIAIEIVQADAPSRGTGWCRESPANPGWKIRRSTTGSPSAFAKVFGGLLGLP
jgi:hypothetical protein